MAREESEGRQWRGQGRGGDGSGARASEGRRSGLRGRKGCVSEAVGYTKENKRKGRVRRAEMR